MFCWHSEKWLCHKIAGGRSWPSKSSSYIQYVLYCIIERHYKVLPVVMGWGLPAPGRWSQVWLTSKWTLMHHHGSCVATCEPGRYTYTKLTVWNTATISLACLCMMLHLQYACLCTIVCCARVLLTFSTLRWRSGRRQSQFSPRRRHWTWELSSTEDTHRPTESIGRVGQAFYT